jgi:cardiolipin synthase C
VNSSLTGAATKLLRLFLFGFSAFLLGCASLPQSVVRLPSYSIKHTTSPLLAFVHSPSDMPDHSGFRLLTTGPSALDARLVLIERASHTLDIQYYHFSHDETGRRVLRALYDAAKRGVRVRLLIDDLQTHGLDELLLGLAEAQATVEVRLFNPFVASRGNLIQRFLSAPFDFDRLQRRMHNKLMIADGVLAITGGRNIADEYFGFGTVQRFLDLDILVAGALLTQLGAIFDQYWNSEEVFPLRSIVGHSSTESDLHSRFISNTGGINGFAMLPEVLPDPLGLNSVGNEFRLGKLTLQWAKADAFADSPTKLRGNLAPVGLPEGTDYSSIHEYIITQMMRVKKSILAVSPYTIPGNKGVNQVKELRARGVSVQVITNSLLATDEALVYTAYRRYRMEMLRDGAELYEVSASLGRERLLRDIVRGEPILRLHTKCVVFDEEKFFIGSLNFDPRSRDHNTEMGIKIDSPEIAKSAMRMLDLIKNEAAYQVQLNSTNDGVEWVKENAEGIKERVAPPRLGFWRRLQIEILGLVVPEGLL